MFEWAWKKKEHHNLSAEYGQLQDELKAQDIQLKAIKDAESKYEDDKDLEALFVFWENIWNQGGLLFNGSKWTFKLPDLYIEERRYDDALRILRKIKNPEYQDRKKAYIDRVSKLKEREERKNEK